MIAAIRKCEMQNMRHLDIETETFNEMDMLFPVKFCFLIKPLSEKPSLVLAICDEYLSREQIACFQAIWKFTLKQEQERRANRCLHSID